MNELSKPVATVDVQRGRMDGNTFAVAWSSAGHALPDGPHFIYSQEYVSAMLAELEAKDKRIAELEARLATPVRLKKVDSSNVPYAGYGFNAAVDYCADRVRAAGFTVEGDE